MTLFDSKLFTSHGCQQKRTNLAPAQRSRHSFFISIVVVVPVVAIVIVIDPVAGPDRFSPIDPNTPVEQTVKKSILLTMNSEHANYRKVFASFLEEIPQNKGWWYRLPLAPKSSKDGQLIATDAILPHPGNVLGLSEPATLLFLVEMAVSYTHLTLPTICSV